MTAPDLSPAEAEIVARFDAAPTPPEAYTPPSALLDRLDELRAKATQGKWWADDHELYVDLGAGLGDPIFNDPLTCIPGDWIGETCRAEDPVGSVADAALIVAAVNAVGPLTAAVRAVLELADQWDALDMGMGLYPEDSAHRSAHESRAEWCAEELRAALSVTP